MDFVIRQAALASASTKLAEVASPVSEPLTDMEALVREHSRVAYRVCYAVLRNHHDAEDAVQETFLRVMRYDRELKRARNQKTWLCQIAWRVAVDSLPKSPAVDAAEEYLALAQVKDGRITAEDALQQQQTQALLHHMMLTLPKDLLEPLLLSTVRELDSTEIAEVLGIPESSVRTRLMRARESLKSKVAAVLERRR